jgi:hypothetical protein
MYLAVLTVSIMRQNSPLFEDVTASSKGVTHASWLGGQAVCRSKAVRIMFFETPRAVSG